MRAAVFVGPTLPAAAARCSLDAIYLPPVRQGDVYRVGHRMQVDAIAIVDGYFRDVPSVWHKEILWAMSRGIAVLGASSMGALRAAELADFGMEGVGRVFEAYRAGALEPYPGPFEDDDEVAVQHGPAALQNVAVSEALVNLRISLAAAADAGVVSATVRDAVVSGLKALHYPQRTWPRAVAMARDVDPGDGERLAAWYPDHAIDQKRLDAVALLERLAAGDVAAPECRYDFQHTTMWERLAASEEA